MIQAMTNFFNTGALILFGIAFIIGLFRLINNAFCITYFNRGINILYDGARSL